LPRDLIIASHRQDCGHVAYGKTGFVIKSYLIIGHRCRIVYRITMSSPLLKPGLLRAISDTFSRLLIPNYQKNLLE
jgi:hypothetical protein